ncbi:myo-inositol 2-dehydrogenase/D-chiro-inositol 1-dehydrogenase [Clostridium algifaecis]|uniref:Myo-inositol 2-dehydrogenase/D-chiro-inositol 1-dehydrogenase n=2 Tax=Clostridium algifaecis TaxID=1472040 RepID=A0ABS4KS31_9CLOT|nr:inositol 2-dehydrogenase [Clostridium algifaecis]MBP2032834.1 myo-inositol 2-dehydrogenase/D-chiro-inositol 1-dehydrogenase [Clostridium algifaecis]
MKVGIIGAGRIGKVHARNISMYIPEIQIKTIVDPFMNKNMEQFAKKYGIPNITKDANDILNDPEIEAVLICSSTDTHAKYIIKAAKAGKHIFCEKPIDYDLKRVHEAIDAAKNAGVKLQIGFCRRFDHNHHAVYSMVRDGKVGKVNIIKISSRDPEPPSIDYVKVSGGIFYDMMIHDFDMARFLAGSEVTEVNAVGSVLVDPEIGKAGDVDTAVVTLKFENDAIGIIDNSRKAVYGYDQRVEVFGSEGCAFNNNDIPNTAVLCNEDRTSCENTYKVMWDRYTGAFVAEMHAFLDAIDNNKETLVTGVDGLYPVLMAAAATKSLKEGRPVKISEVE